MARKLMKKSYKRLLSEIFSPLRTRSSQALALVITVGIGGCNSITSEQQVPLTETTAPDVLFEAIDTSASNRASVPVITEELATTQLLLDERNSWLTVFRFDRETQELYSGPLPNSDEALLTELTPKLSTFSAQDNTYLEKAFAVLAKRVPACKGKSVAVVATDGFCEGMTEKQHSSLKESAKKLAASLRLQAVFIEGANPSNMARLRADFESLGDKVQFVAVGGLNQNTIAQYLNTGGGEGK